MGKAVSGIMLALLLASTLRLAFNIQPVKSDYAWTETIYIRADGSIHPADAPISIFDNVTYTLTDNIVGAVLYDWSSAIVIERGNIVVDGAGYTVEGTEASWSKGIDLTGQRNVTIKNMEIKKFYYGIWLDEASNNSMVGNNITANKWAGI
ncbi:hypothetical protein G4O51_13635, partial [Candidatus Bathyarchaeota archaeon A05DMB-2]|nr:hypothetical protein [Candidatus Bathyarchaeota archaeon A05DMB-2]